MSYWPLWVVFSYATILFALGMFPVLLFAFHQRLDVLNIAVKNSVLAGLLFGTLTLVPEIITRKIYDIKPWDTI